MPYAIDFKTISLSNFKSILKKSYLIPSQELLLDDVDSRFKKLEGLGLKTLDQLHEALKTKAKAIKFAKDNSLPEKWTEVLSRFIRSYIPKTRKLSEFKYLEPQTLKALKKLDIKTTEELYPYVLTAKSRKELKDAGVSDEQVQLLTRIADVSRLRYVSPDFATVLAYSSCNTVAKIRKADSAKLYAELIAMNEGNKYYRGKFGENDIKFLIADAKTRENDIK